MNDRGKVIGTERPQDLIATASLSAPVEPVVTAGAARRQRRARRRTTLQPGAMVGRYKILAALGEGGMGVVYKALEPELDRAVALKLLNVRDAGIEASGPRARLLREAKALAQLAHPNVVAVHDVGAIDGDVFVAMEFVEGVTLRAWLAAARRSKRDILEMFRAAGAGLAAAHQVGIVHRDFKPDNVIIGNDGRVRVLDFGLARSFDQVDEPPDTPEPARVDDESLEATVELSANEPLDLGAVSASDLHASPRLSRVTRWGVVTGTPAYMAPEQHRGGEVDARSDQFAFCIALHEALYGKRPFVGATIDQLRAAVLGGELTSPPRRSGVSARVRRAVLRGLSHLPDARHPDMSALLHELGGGRRQRLVVGVVVTTTVVTAAAVAVAMITRAREDVCTGAEAQLAGVWDPGVRAATRSAFAAVARPYAVETFDRVAGALDERAAAWVAMRREVCVATRVHAEQSEQLMELKVQCLDRRLGELRALTRLFAMRRDAEVVDQAMSATLDLPSLARCSDADALVAASSPPRDSRASAIEALRGRLDEVEALGRAGKYAEGLTRAAPIARDAAQVDWPPVHAHALFWLGTLQARTGDAAAGAATLERAMKRAAVARDDTLFLRAGTARVHVLGHDLGQPDEALQLGAVLDPLVTRAGDAPGDRAALLAATARVLLATGAAGAAAEQLARALPLIVKARGPDHPDVAAAHHDLGTALTAHGRLDEAVLHLRQALAISERTLGPHHPRTADARARLGRALGRQATSATTPRAD